MYPSLPMKELGVESGENVFKVQDHQRLKSGPHLTAGWSKTGVWLVTTAFGLDVRSVVAGG